MFRCELCAIVPEFKGRGPRVSRPGEKCVMVATEQRPAEYPSRSKAHRVRVGRKPKFFDDPGGAGYEIAKEVKACTQCAAEYATMQKDAEEAAYGTSRSLHVLA